MTTWVLTRQRPLDRARGLAVVSMVIAHTCPVGGLFNVTEYLTAPLFALVLGASQAYAWHHTAATPGRFWAAESLRGLILIVLGAGLQALYPPIWDVLITLGLLLMVLPPLLALRRRRAVLVALTVVLVAATAPLGAVGRATIGDADAAWLARQAAFWTIGHPAYPLHTMLAYALVGVLMALPLARGAWGRGPLLTTAATGGLMAAAALLAGRRWWGGGAPYDGSYPSVLSSLALAAGTLALCFALRDGPPGRQAAVMFPLEAMGRLALSCYVLQIVWLALVTSLLTGGADDSWPVMISLLVSLAVFATGWVRLRGPLGPAEWLLRLPRTQSRTSRSVP